MGRGETLGSGLADEAIVVKETPNENLISPETAKTKETYE
jgi:hypothetical protein